MPKVVIDLRMVRGTLHGIARYALELACRLPPLAPEWEFVGLTSPQGLPSDLGALTPRIPLKRCGAEFLSPFEQPALMRSLIQSSCDLFHATSFSLPALWGGPLVATLHDANHLALRQLYGAGRVAYYRLVVGPRARSARALITVSQFSREELGRHLRLSPYRFQVIYPGVSDGFSPPSPEALQHFLRERGLPLRYFVTVGSEKSHKNLSLLAEVARSLPAPLVVLAGRGAARRLGFGANAIALDPLPDGQMPLLYGGATALLLPSRYEGFGLPALEAMASGCPVVVAAAGALPEVIGDAGLLASADDAQGFLDAAFKVFRNDALRSRLIEAGKQRALRFRWEDCVLQTLAVYRRALER